MVPSAFDDVVESVRAALNAKRGEAATRIAAIEAALRGYERALEYEIAEAFASEHQLKQPARAERVAEAAQKLARAVASLPELSSAPRAPQKSVEPEPENEPIPAKRRAAGGKLVIIGALAGRDKSSSLPPEQAADAEWIDIERDGAHAVGNLPQRIRQGRVAGIVILERVVSHKHTDPVVSAAREARVPVVFAGQGGKASLARALAQLGEMQRERA
jgi:hypothetical protein